MNRRLSLQTLNLNLPFTFPHLHDLEVHRTAKMLDPNKSAEPDQFNPYFLKLAADVIAELQTYIFNFHLSNSEIPVIWKSALVFPLLKGSFKCL